MQELASATIKRSIATLEAFAKDGLEPVVQAAEAMAQAMTSGRKVLAFGNGGSAADAQHFVAELVNRFLMERPPLPAVSLTTDTSILTSIANDYHFDEVFVRQIKALGVEGDIALGISTSGRSPNVLQGLVAARSRGLVTIGLSGAGAGEMAPLCDILITAPSDETPRVQETHTLVVHLICEMVDVKLFGRSK
jgi:D-sedoheptulose 7-phosphate isomerase